MAARSGSSPSGSPPLTPEFGADAPPFLTWDADDEPLMKKNSKGKPAAATKSKSKAKPAAATKSTSKPKSTLMRSQSVSVATKAISIANLVKGKGGKPASAKGASAKRSVSDDKVRDSEEENDDNDDEESPDDEPQVRQVYAARWGACLRSEP